VESKITSPASSISAVVGAMPADYWTTEQVAEYLGLTVQQVYESSRRGEWPGNVGKQRGRRNLFRSDLIQSGPQEPKTTSDPVEALLWTAQGIEAKLGEILTILRPLAQPRFYLGHVDDGTPNVVMHPGDYSGIYFGLADGSVHITGNRFETEEEE
jgi:hypothetical protein